MPLRVRPADSFFGFRTNRGDCRRASRCERRPAFTVGAAPTPTWPPRCARAQAVKDALAPWHAGYDYDNFEETPSPASAVLPSASYRPLQKIKAACDPAT
jgi:hypothetical protein